MRKASLFAALALLAAPAAVMAEGISYSYLDARYFSTDSDALNINQHGGTLAGSLALGSIFFVAADGSYGQTEKVSSGTSSGRFDTVGATARLGAHYALTDTLDIVADGGGLYSKYNGKGAFNGQDADDFGYLAETGLRLLVVPAVELGAFYTYQNVKNDEKSGFTADLQYHFDAHFSAVASATNTRSTDVYTVGARYRF